MKPSVYIETTIPSYLTAWRSPSLLMAAQQEATRNWWDTVRAEYDLFISGFVVAECSSGDTDAAQRRLGAIRGIPELEASESVEILAEKLLQVTALPSKAKLDALHIAVATVHGIDYLLTWNCKHIANAVTRPKIEWACRSAGFEPPIICTPLELMKD